MSVQKLQASAAQSLIIKFTRMNAFSLSSDRYNKLHLTSKVIENLTLTSHWCVCVCSPSPDDIFLQQLLDDVDNVGYVDFVDKTVDGLL